MENQDYNKKYPIDKVRESIQKHPKLYIFTTIFLFIFITCLIIFIAFYNNSHDYKITITNLDEYTKNMPSSTKNNIYEAVYRAVETNSDKDVASISLMNATLRENTFKETYNKNTSVYSGEFIVDIEEVKQSYRIYYDWTSNNKSSTLISSYGASATCLKMSDMIYPFFKCTNAYDDINLANYNYLYMILPYNTTTEDGVAISISEVDYYYGSNEPFIRISVDACGDEKILNEGVNLIRNYLSSYNLNLDDYKYLTKNLCDGGDL